jgi:putative toxin-antitoxin system antitoxin component (TIGR02293 family)
MTRRNERRAQTNETVAIERVTDLMGGAKVFRSRVRRSLEVHEVLSDGLPAMALRNLLHNVRLLYKSEFLEPGIGMSLRTVQRFRVAPAKLLSTEQSGRVWKFAEILTKATAVFGSQAAAEKWLGQPATGLDQRRPIDLLATPAGVKLVEEFLERLEYGVYA